MSTKAYVGIKNPDGNIDFICCRHHGCLENLGITLFSHYGTEDKIRELLSYGDTSTITDTLEETKKYAYKEGKNTDMHTLSENKFRKEVSLDGEDFIEFGYVFDNDRWTVQSLRAANLNDNVRTSYNVYDLEKLFHDETRLKPFSSIYVKSYQETFMKQLREAKKDPDAIKKDVKETAGIDTKTKEEVKEDKKEETKETRPYSKEAKREWAINKQEEMQNALEKGIKDVFHGEEWKNYLKLSENFSNYSPTNKLLVLIQKPDATIVKGAGTWKKEYDRTITDNNGIYIFAPSTYSKTKEMPLEKAREKYPDYIVKEDTENDKATVRFDLMNGYKAIKVFDVSQTEGKELPPHKFTKKITESEYSDKALDKIIEKLTEVSPVSVSFKDKEEDDTLKRGANGYYSTIRDEIVIDKDLPKPQMVKTIVHEITHSKLHGNIMRVQGIPDTEKIDNRSEMEIQAESVAFIVCDEIGIDTKDYSFGYLASYFDNVISKEDDIKKEFSKLSSAIFKCSDEITKSLSLDKVLEQIEEEENEEEEEMEI